MLLNLLPFALIGVFAWIIIRGTRQVGSQAQSFGRSQARRFEPASTNVTLDDVAGIDEAKQELREVVEFLSTPDRFRALGAHIPKGVLIVGPPGTGKTLLARAVAGEANVPFFTISGSEFVEMFVGVGASRVRDLFNEAKRHTPCIVFIDEIDAVGRQRGYGPGIAHEEREQTLNQILVEMDGFDPETNVMVVAATNRPDILDPALLRPGRFDRKIMLDLPDVKGREAILRVHLRGKPLEPDLDLAALARATAGFSGADLANLANEGAILAARRGRSRIVMTDFDESIDRVMLGPERRSRVMSADERKLTAYHESGHVVVGHLMEHHDRPQKVSIVARGAAGGYTKFLPEEETRYRTATMLRDRMCAALGGYAAEAIVFGEPSTGAANDLDEVTEIARRMVMRWGMSTDLGARTFGRGDEYAWLRETEGSRGYSDEAAIAIDREVRQLTDEAMARARRTLDEHRDLLERLVRELLEHETLQGEDLERLLRNNGVRDAGQAADSGTTPPPAPATRLA
jgi:cell division protease FtsH